MTREEAYDAIVSLIGPTGAVLEFDGEEGEPSTKILGRWVSIGELSEDGRRVLFRSSHPDRAKVACVVLGQAQSWDLALHRAREGVA